MNRKLYKKHLKYARSLQRSELEYLYAAAMTKMDEARRAVIDACVQSRTNQKRLETLQDKMR